MKFTDSTIEPDKLARLARLGYVSDSDTGFSRERNGHGLVYLNARGRKLRDQRQIARIEGLAIPPAWTDVWICRSATGHLQATGFDDRRRKQYLYHGRWRSIADSAKFLRLEEFGRLLPKLRKSVARALRGKGLTRDRVLAGMVAVFDATSIRVGNEEYVRANKSYGLSTLRTRHVAFNNGSVELRFRAKGGFHREVTTCDRQIVRLMRALKRLPGALVFQYRNGDNAVCRADSIAVNEYLREVTGRAITAKDFRTWKASSLAAGRLYAKRDVEDVRKRKRIIKKTIAEVAEILGNTPAVCRKSYIHPGLLAAYESGDYSGLFERFAPRSRNSYSRDEHIFSRFLRRWEPSKQV